MEEKGREKEGEGERGGEGEKEEEEEKEEEKGGFSVWAVEFFDCEFFAPKNVLSGHSEILSFEVMIINHNNLIIRILFILII